MAAKLPIRAPNAAVTIMRCRLLDWAIVFIVISLIVVIG
jgi:hypothetical protein